MGAPGADPTWVKFRSSSSSASSSVLVGGDQVQQRAQRAHAHECTPNVSHWPPATVATRVLATPAAHT